MKRLAARSRCGPRAPVARSTDPCLPAAPLAARKSHRKRAVEVASKIVADVLREGMERGAKLPNESELLERYAVSRSSLREALRLLEVQGLVKIRPGPGSGTEVGGVEAVHLAGTLSLYLALAHANLQQLLDAWRAVEPMLARMAAENADRARVDAAMQPFASGPLEASRDIDEGLAFHDLVAELADNPVLALVFGAIGALVTEQVGRANPGFALSDATLHAHHAIADAIIAGDGDAAFAAMQAHLDAVTCEIRDALQGRERNILLSIQTQGGA